MFKLDCFHWGVFKLGCFHWGVFKLGCFHWVGVQVRMFPLGGCSSYKVSPFSQSFPSPIHPILLPPFTQSFPSHSPNPPFLTQPPSSPPFHLIPPSSPSFPPHPPPSSPNLPLTHPPLFTQPPPHPPPPFLPSNLILPRASPYLLLATHQYVPKSDFLTSLILKLSTKVGVWLLWLVWLVWLL